MTTATATTTRARDRRDWYAVSRPSRAIHPRGDFTHVAMALAAAGPADRARVTLALADLAEDVGVSHLVPDADDPEVAVARLGAHILARYVDRPAHPAVARAARAL